MSESEQPTSSLLQQFNSWRSEQQQQPQQGSVLNDFTSTFTSTYNNIYNQLPIHQQDIEGTKYSEPEWFKLSTFERLALFLLFIGGSVLCFTLSIFMFPVLILKPKKFVLLWTLGSLLFMLSFGCLQGPYNYVKHLISKERLPFTIVFFSSNFFTFYSAFFLKSTILTIISGILGLLSVLYYTFSYFPFGAQGFQMLMNLGLRQFSSMVGL